MAVADTYLKGGDMQEAELWDNTVKTSSTYATSAYQDVLEQRLADLGPRRRISRRRMPRADRALTARLVGEDLLLFDQSGRIHSGAP